MNAFVNYQSRSVELPEGCKDLIDVLNLARASATQSTQTRQGLADVGTFVSRISTSAATFRSLWIHCDATALVAMFCGKYGLRALVLVDADREQAVRAIFADSGVSPFEDDLLPNSVRGLQYQLPSISDLHEFLRDLLTNGFSVTQDTALDFRYREKDAARHAR